MQDLNQGFYLDATSIGNNSRYANHSCDPNCRMKLIQLLDSPFYVNFMVSMVDIKCGDKLTMDYAWFRSDTGIIDLNECRCMEFGNSRSCRGYL